MRAEALQQDGTDWATPLLWRREFRNILASHLRRNSLRYDDTCAIQAEAADLLAGSKHRVESRRVLLLARDSARTAYEGELAAPPQRLAVTLMTMAAKSLRALSKRAVALDAR